MAGSILALELQDSCDIQILERGPKGGEKPSHVNWLGHPIGIQPNHYYGKGGTTQLWAGGLIAMLREEYSELWPSGLAEALPDQFNKVIELLYGRLGLETWEKVKSTTPELAPLDQIYYDQPYRFSENQQLDRLTIRYNYTVERLEETDSGVRVFPKHGCDSKPENFDRVIIAAGGINSPAILLRSELGGEYVGQGLMDHPMGFVAKISNWQNEPLLRKLRSLDRQDTATNQLLKFRDDDTQLWSAFYLRAAATGSLNTDPYRRSFKVLAETGKLRRNIAAVSQFYDLDFMAQAIEERFRKKIQGKYAYVLAVNEQNLDPQSQVTLSADGAVNAHWTFGDEVEQSIIRNLRKLQDVLQCDLDIVDSPLRNRLFSAAHLSGTCRMSDTPAGGVVDANLKVHGTRNIFVCDGSVLPSIGCSNTGLTIGALAMRLASTLHKTV